MTAARSLYMAQQEIGGQTYPPPFPAPPPREEEQPAPVIRPHFERRTAHPPHPEDHDDVEAPAEEVQEEAPPSSQKSSEKA